MSTSGKEMENGLSYFPRCEVLSWPNQTHSHSRPSWSEHLAHAASIKFIYLSSPVQEKFKIIYRGFMKSPLHLGSNTSVYLRKLFIYFFYFLVWEWNSH